MAEKIIVIDTSKCTACRGCQTACKQWNNLSAVQTVNKGSYENPPDLTYNTYTRILFNEVEDGDDLRWLFGQQRCMHCSEAGCFIACPVPGAIVRDTNGAVVINQEVCTGCKYCVFGCPFNIPRFDRKDNEGMGADKAYKCTLCFDRQSIGMQPACTKTCPTGALAFKNRSDLAGIRASAEEKGMTVYDGGDLRTNVVFLLEDSPSAYGLPSKPSIPLPTFLWRKVWKPLGALALLGTIVALLAHYVTVGPKDADEEGGDSDVSSPY